MIIEIKKGKNKVKITTKDLDLGYTSNVDIIIKLINSIKL